MIVMIGRLILETKKLAKQPNPYPLARTNLSLRVSERNLTKIAHILDLILKPSVDLRDGGLRESDVGRHDLCELGPCQHVQVPLHASVADAVVALGPLARRHIPSTRACNTPTILASFIINQL
jgi:hypothetical protein